MKRHLFNRHLVKGTAVVSAAALGLATLTVAGGGATAAAAAKKPKPISMKASLIGLPPLAYALWANVATKQGYFKKLGLNMSWQYNGHGVTVAKMVVAGSVDVTDTASTAVVTLIANGAPDKVVFGQNTEDWQIGTDAPGVTSCKGLKGMTIGTDGTGNSRELFLAAVLKTCGLTITDVTQNNIASVPADMEKAAIAGQLQAGVFHVNELSQVQSQAKSKWVSVTVPKSVIDAGHYDMTMAPTSFIKNNKQAITRFVAAKILAVNWMMTKKNFNAFAKLASTLQGTSLAVEKASIKTWQKIKFWAPGMGLTKSNVTGLVNTLVGINAFPATKAPSYKQLVTAKIYPAALKLAKTINKNVK